MKKYIMILLFSFIMGTENASAQTAKKINQVEQSIKSNGKYALLVMNPKHLNVAILTGERFKNKSKKIDFQIVTCGEVVKEISANEELKKSVVEAVQKYGLKIVVCGLTVKQLNIDKALLPPETPIVDNGIVYMFGLEELGYKSIII
jgi:intracellular sulfur oxidation DsrE/DsrF family protein